MRLISRLRVAALAAILVTPIVVLAGAGPVGASDTTLPITGLASVTTGGVPGGALKQRPSVSAGGRFIAFASAATNLVAGDTNGKTDVFVRDTLAATTTRVSVTSGLVQGNGPSDQPNISANGRWVVFRSAATNLVAGDTNGKTDIFLHDMVTGKTTRVSLANGGFAQVDGDSSTPSVSADGVRVLFTTEATNIVTTDTDSHPKVVLRNVNGTTELEAVTSSEVAFDGASDEGAMSADARYIVFGSPANDVGIDTNNSWDTFLRDRTSGTTELISLAHGSITTAADHGGDQPSVSDDGRYVAFRSSSTNVVASDANAGVQDIYVRDRTGGTTSLANVSTGGTQANFSSYDGVISANGQAVVFGSDSNNLVPGAVGGQVYRRSLVGHTTTEISLSTNGDDQNGYENGLAISSDGASAAWATTATNLISPDTDALPDVVFTGTQHLGPYPLPQSPMSPITQDFLGHASTVAQNVAFLGQVVTGINTPSAQIITYAHGAYSTYRAPVMRLYFAFFKRVPDAGGLDYWVSQYQGGRSLASIADFFATSNEFKTTYGNTTNSAFVTLVYQNVLGRSPDANGLSYWVGQLNGGETRGAMMVGFSESAEGKALRRPEVDSVLLRKALLHRLPTTPEFNADVALLRGNATDGPRASAVLALQIISAAEYATLHP